MSALVISDSFKGTLSSGSVGSITTKFLNRRNVTCEYYKVSDGGEGFLEAIDQVDGLDKYRTLVNDAFFNKHYATYLVDSKKKTLYIELANVCGITLVEQKNLNPLLASTYGLGEVIANAIHRFPLIENVIVGLGGSCSNDGGSGLLECLGVRFYQGDKLLKHMNNNQLQNITKIDTTYFDEKYNHLKITICSDVTNPLLGANGATFVYALQKGAKDLNQLEHNMVQFVEYSKSVKRIDSTLPGMGAAGGTTFGFNFFNQVKIVSGVDYLITHLNLKDKIKQVDEVITGEGAFDEQSLMGKLISGIISYQPKKLIILCGIKKIDSVYPVYPICPLVATSRESKSEPKKYLKKLLEYLYARGLV